MRKITFVLFFCILALIQAQVIPATDDDDEKHGGMPGMPGSPGSFGLPPFDANGLPPPPPPGSFDDDISNGFPHPPPPSGSFGLPPSGDGPANGYPHHPLPGTFEPDYTGDSNGLPPPPPPPGAEFPLDRDSSESFSASADDENHEVPDHLNDDDDEYHDDAEGQHDNAEGQHDNADDSDASGSDSEKDCDDKKKRGLCIVLLAIGAVLVLGTICLLKKKKKLCFKARNYSHVVDVEAQQFELTEKGMKNQTAPAPIHPLPAVPTAKDGKSASVPVQTPGAAIPVAVATAHTAYPGTHLPYPDAGSMMAMAMPMPSAGVAHVAPVMSVATIHTDPYPAPKF